MPEFPTERPLQYRGQVVRLHPTHHFVCLSDLWRAEGCPADRHPGSWLRGDAARWLRSAPGAAPAARMLEVLEGERTVVFADAEIATLYARYLSPECYEWALETIVSAEPESPAVPSGRPLPAQVDQPSRRRLLQAGWAVPIVIAMALTPRKAYAHTDHDFSNGGHLDSPL